MKLEDQESRKFIEYLRILNAYSFNLLWLQNILPKTTLEILILIYKSEMLNIEAEKTAVVLGGLVVNFNFGNINAFDKNTSHIIGKEWHEIDYPDENMTWEKQKQKYMQH